MKLNLFFISLVFLSSVNLKAQRININTNPYWEGEIILNDGTTKNGFVQVPNDPGINRVSIKKTKNGKKERIKKKDIKSLTVISKSGKKYEFEPVPVVTTIKGNASLGKSMLLVKRKNDYVKFYISYGLYRVNDEGELYMLYKFQQGKDFPTLNYYIKKQDYEKARLLHMTGLVRGFKKGANHYLTEDPDLLKRINDGELKFKDINQILDIYMESTKNL